MNYIKQLQQDNEEMIATILDVETLINDFQRLLNLPKHNGVDCNGDRSDWIATSDVQTRLQDIRTRLFSCK